MLQFPYIHIMYIDQIHLPLALFLIPLLYPLPYFTVFTEFHCIMYFDHIHSPAHSPFPLSLVLVSFLTDSLLHSCLNSAY
jgi:hypothetical protein